MAKKKITKKLKFQIEAGKATPAGALGPALGQAGVNIGEFVNQFNEKTREISGDIVNVLVDVHEDRSFAMTIKTSPASHLLKKAAKVEKGSGKNVTDKAGTVTKQQIREIAEAKIEDLNAHDVDAAVKMIEGTARSMGIEVK